jgi:hypothetical protein
MGKKNGTQPQVGWRIHPEIIRRVNVEAAKRSLRPARVVEQALLAMLELVDDAAS